VGRDNQLEPFWEKEKKKEKEENVTRKWKKDKNVRDLSCKR
jgi:hypothetical protein